jgi:hypothetical protein
MDKEKNLHKFEKKFKTLGKTKVMRIPESIYDKLSDVMITLEKRAELETKTGGNGIDKVNELLTKIDDIMGTPFKGNS